MFRGLITMSLPVVVASAPSQTLGHAWVWGLSLPKAVAGSQGRVLLVRDYELHLQGTADSANPQGWFLQLLDGCLAWLKLWPWGFTTGHAQALASPAPLPLLPAPWDSSLGDHDPKGPSLQWHECELERDGAGNKTFYSIFALAAHLR